MAISRWEPFRELARMQGDFNRLFDDRLWGPLASMGKEEMTAGAYYPAVDVYEDAEGITLTAELPGVESKDVDVRVENNVLTLQGSRKLEREEKKDNYRRIERSYGSFMRSFTLPPSVDADKVKAEFKNGVLRLTMPKKEEAKPRAIKVKVE